MSTPHIAAAPGDFAGTVLMPGDPLRARHIATRLLEGAVEVTNVRNMLGYTGKWRGQPVSVMGSGIGMPSCMLYATELYRDYGVRRIVRVGTCGALPADVQLGDIVVAQGACTDSTANRLAFGGYDFAAIASWPLLRAVTRAAEARGQLLRVGNVFSSDFFYHPDPHLNAMLERHGVLALDMESAGLYRVAAEQGREALAVMAVSDHLGRGEHISPAQRETGLDAMIQLVLEAVMSA